ncbi:uncharacterized protein LOC143301370 isoform X1 [Babylonia areolata]|uniref:uncharacterized protein LOC143301370 isoform X1 n=1 Tax=Babylonia areolata TaxID=304850 RepID=UPI003FD49B1D
MAAVASPFLVALLVTCFLFAAGEDRTEEDSSILSGVSIDDVIDLDAAPSEDKPDDVVLTSFTGNDGAADTTVGHGNFIARVTGPASPRANVTDDVIKPALHHLPMTSDDEDMMEISGDGSGSGDDMVVDKDDAPSLTLTSSNVSTTPASSPSSDVVNVTMAVPPMFAVEEGGDISTEEVDNTMTSEDDVTVSDVVYNGDIWPPQPVKEQRDQKKEHQRWSRWIRTDDVTEVRLRKCASTAEPCNGTEAEVRHCDAENKTCDVINATVTTQIDDAARGELCSEKGRKEEATTTPSSPSTTQSVHSKTTTAATTSTSEHHDADSNPCAYSLYDVKRGKFVAAQWSLSQLVTQAKAKKWCSMPERFLVLHSPFQHCRRYFDDLCHVSIRCKGRRTPPRTHGDLTDGCWRRFVYGGRLPRGLTDRWANVYLLCQRFAAMSSLGQRIDPAVSHFATLFDTKGRAPVASMARLTQLGDLAWPRASYFIEHGLVEDTQTSEWLLQKPKAGMVQLSELGVCSHDYSCQLGAHQALPSDYSATTYRVAPLLWPELAGPDPWSMTATLTLTNSAPMHAGLYPLWHRAVLRLRQFAVQQCGVPYLPSEHFQRGYAGFAGKSRTGEWRGKH